MQNISGGTLGQPGRINHPAPHTALYHITHHRGAVVVEEVVAILTVLGTTVPNQVGHHHTGFLPTQLEYLFGDTRPPLCVRPYKSIKIHGIYHVVTLPKDKAPDKVRLRE